MSREDEFFENHKHIFDHALQFRENGKNDLANLIYYLLHENLHKCRLLDQQSEEILKLKKKEM